MVQVDPDWSGDPFGDTPGSPYSAPGVTDPAIDASQGAPGPGDGGAQPFDWQGYMNDWLTNWSANQTPADQTPAATDFTIPTGQETLQDITQSPYFQGMEQMFQTPSQSFMEMDAPQQEAAFGNIWANNMTEADKKEFGAWYQAEQAKYSDQMGDPQTKAVALGKIREAYAAKSNEYMTKYGQAGGGGAVAQGWEALSGIAKGIPGAVQPYMTAQQKSADYLAGGEPGKEVLGGPVAGAPGFVWSDDGMGGLAPVQGEINTGNPLQDTLYKVQDLAAKAGMPMQEIADINKITGELQKDPEQMQQITDLAAKLEGGTATNEDMQQLQTMITGMETAGEEGLAEMADIAKGLKGTSPAMDTLADEIQNLKTTGVDQAKLDELTTSAKDLADKMADGTASNEDMQKLQTMVDDVKTAGGEALTEMGTIAEGLKGMSPELDTLAEMIGDVKTAGMDDEEAQQAIADKLADAGTEELATLKTEIENLKTIGDVEATQLTGLASKFIDTDSETIKKLKDIAIGIADADPDTEQGQLAIAKALNDIENAQPLKKQRAIAASMGDIATGAMAEGGEIAQQQQLAQQLATLGQTEGGGMLAQQIAAAQGLAPSQAGFKQQIAPMMQQALAQVGRSGITSGSAADKAISGMLGSQWQQYQLPRQEAQMAAYKSILGQQAGLNESQQIALQNILSQQMGLQTTQQAAWSGIGADELARQKASATIQAGVGEQAAERQRLGMEGMSAAAMRELQRQQTGTDILTGQQTFGLEKGKAVTQGAAQAAQQRAQEMAYAGDIYGQQAQQDIMRQQAAMAGQADLTGQLTQRGLAAGQLYGQQAGQQIAQQQAAMSGQADLAQLGLQGQQGAAQSYNAMAANQLAQGQLDVSKQQAVTQAQAGLAGEQTARNLAAGQLFGQGAQADIAKQQAMAAAQGNLTQLGMQGQRDAGTLYAQQMAQETARQQAAMQGLQAAGGLTQGQNQLQANMLSQLAGTDIQRQQAAAAIQQGLAGTAMGVPQAQANILGNLTGQQVGAYQGMAGMVPGYAPMYQNPYNVMAGLLGGS